MGTATTVSILLGFICAVLMAYLENVLGKNANYELDNKRLKEESEKLEYFLSEYFLLRLNDQELLETFLSILDNYMQGKEFPKNFLYLICKNLKCYKLMHAAILLEIDRFAKISQDRNGYTTAKGRDSLSKQQKLNDLLADLEKQNENFGNRNKMGFINAPDILIEQARERHGCGIINDA